MTITLACSTTLGAQQSHDNRARGAMDAPHAPAVGEPASTPMTGVMRQVGAWSLMTHGWMSAIRSSASGPRAARATYSTSMLSLNASRTLAGGTLTVRGMASLEPSMPRDGYPLLLQTGESADGLNPLRDRQHPHDLIDEAAVEYRRAINADLSGYVYVAPVGAPALGPVPFFHRLSGSALPEAPIGHHLHDATHITHGVVTAGLVANRRLTIEASAFNGREPDANRWDVDRIRLDSYALRAGVLLGTNWAMQGSMASVSQPERTHPLIDASRLSASVTHNRPLRDGNWQTTAAYGRTLTRRRVVLLSEARRVFPAPILAHYLAIAPPADVPEDSLYLQFPERLKGGWLLESQLQRGRSTFVGRVERLDKDELFAPSDLRHSAIFRVTKASAGYLWRVIAWRDLAVDAGGAVHVHQLPAPLRAAYGRTPTSYQLYTRLRVGNGS